MNASGERGGRAARGGRVAAGLCAALATAACGASQEQFASQANAAAEAAVATAQVDAQAAQRRGKSAVTIPGGTFSMGSNDAFWTAEHPVHSVQVAAFSMDRTEVTTAAYAACVASGVCTPAGTGEGCNAGVAGRENHPINCVDWNQATAYCAAQGQRLPTEEEWEYAARGTDGRMNPWGNEAPRDQLCWSSLSKGQTCAVGAYPKGDSPFGLADMAGNVWEWTASGYLSSYSSPREDSHRVTRGGGWDDDAPPYFRTAYRYRNYPTNQLDNLGFRCAGAPLP